MNDHGKEAKKRNRGVWWLLGLLDVVGWLAGWLFGSGVLINFCFELLAMGWRGKRASKR